MIIIPKETPIISDLNSYYINIIKLFEHYQGVVDSGCIYFKSPASEGVIFFDEENLINGIYETKKNTVKGREAIDILVAEAEVSNFIVTIYEIVPERINFWANIANAEYLHRDLSTEYTDLDGLIKKMTAEKLTGFIEVSFSDKSIGILFFLNGDWVASSSSEKKGELMRDETFNNGLIGKSHEKKAMLNVKKVLLEPFVDNYTSHSQESVPSNTPKLAKPSTKAPPATKATPPQKQVPDGPLRILDMLQQLMLIFERFISSNKKIKEDFDTILRRKFMEKLDKYDFLDPFAADFSYSDGKIDYKGRADLNVVAKGLIESLQEISQEIQMQEWLNRHLLPWKEKYAREIQRISVKL